ncbi:unnamed protein product [Choristocarpus tenellus]
MNRSVNVNQLVESFHPRYKEVHRIKQDINNVLRFSNNLDPKSGTLTLNTGRVCTLIELVGTIEMTYRGHTYNTPVEIYLPESYPQTPPMVYVRPQTGMSLKIGHQHVDRNGMVYLPYLHDWAAATHNLVTLCATMSSVFGADPPLFVTPKTGPPPPAPGHQSMSGGNYLGMGATGVGTTGTAGSGGGISPGQLFPPLPPRPKDVRDGKERELTMMLQVTGSLNLNPDSLEEFDDGMNSINKRF